MYQHRGLQGCTDLQQREVFPRQAILLQRRADAVCQARQVAQHGAESTKGYWAGATAGISHLHSLALVTKLCDIEQLWSSTLQPQGASEGTNIAMPACRRA